VRDRSRSHRTHGRVRHWGWVGSRATVAEAWLLSSTSAPSTCGSGHRSTRTVHYMVGDDVRGRVGQLRKTARAVRQDRIAARRARALCRLVERRLPLEFDVTGDHAAWPAIGAAVLSRATTTMRHMLDLRGHGHALDGATLGRSLYEHVVHLAWIAADPSPARIEAWRKDDLENRLKADRDARGVGVELLDDVARRQLEHQVGAMTGNRLNLADLAVAADKHWAGRLPGMGGHTKLSSLRGFYAILYRNYSTTAHPSYMGLNHVVQDVSAVRKRVVIEQRDPDSRGPYGMATVVYAMALFVAAEAFRWPTRQEIFATFERHPARP
jgi:hypothetical protein